jgi:hypothetical protein
MDIGSVPGIFQQKIDPESPGIGDQISNGIPGPFFSALMNNREFLRFILTEKI